MTLFPVEWRKRHPTAPTSEQESHAPHAVRPQSGQAATLSHVEAGSRARIIGFAPAMSTARRTHLQAYGLLPGVWVRVLQQKPVTVVQVEHVELALEDELAQHVHVTV